MRASSGRKACVYNTVCWLYTYVSSCQRGRLVYEVCVSSGARALLINAAEARRAGAGSLWKAFCPPGCLDFGILAQFSAQQQVLKTCSGALGCGMPKRRLGIMTCCGFGFYVIVTFFNNKCCATASFFIQDLDSVFAKNLQNYLCT